MYQLDERGRLAHFWQRIRIQGDCWLWTGGKTTNGYGKVWNGQRMMMAHRWMYEKANGPIPGRLQLDHLCRRRSCVNPKHLQVVTNRENVVLRCTGITAKAFGQTHCIHGHPFDEKNTRICPNGHRACRACELARWHRRNGEKLERGGSDGSQEG